MNNDTSKNRSKGNPESAGAFEVALYSAEYRRRIIVKYILDHGPSTLDQVSAAWGIFPNQISGRFSELKAAGILYPTSEMVTTRTGARARVIGITKAWELKLRFKQMDTWPRLIDKKERVAQQLSLSV